jgi:phenylacetate-CoA oxygenase PaaJ subunit
LKNYQDIFELFSEIPDPEIPVISIVELGVIRFIEVIDEISIKIIITPTYSGCPAMKQIEDDVRKKLIEHGFSVIELKTIFSPPWTTDWITSETKEKLRQKRMQQVFTEEMNQKRKNTMKKLCWLHHPITKKNCRILPEKIQDKLNEGYVNNL